MPWSSAFQAPGTRGSPVGLALAFAAGFLAVPAFHQVVHALLHGAGVVPMPPFNVRPTAPLGVPAVLSASFWGGVWGIVFAMAVPRLSRAAVTYWVAALAFGAVAPTLIYAFVVTPLRTGAPPPNLGGALLVGSLLNGAWGIGTAMLLALFERMRRTASPNS